MFQQVDALFTVRPIPPPDGQQSLVLKLAGHMAGESARSLRQAVEPVFISPTPPRITLLMDDVNYIDSTGVGVIVAIIQQMRRSGGKLEISGLSDVGRQLLQILKISSLSEYVTVANP
jgi:anti-sigma B factor antagonist